MLLPFPRCRTYPNLQSFPKLENVRIERQWNHTSHDSREEHMYQVLSSFDTLKNCFADDAYAVQIIDREIDRANEWIGEQAPDEPDREPRSLGRVGARENSNTVRSIFDDIDTDGDPEDE